jgi:hypothetical protein
MMPVLRINDATFADLKNLATWFGTRTPSETIDRIVRDAMDQLGLERDVELDDVPPAGAGRATEFQDTPSLTFAKPLTATIDGKPISKVTWLSILLAVIAQVRKKGLEGEKLVQELRIGSKRDPYGDEGYAYYPDLGISVQGQSAADAWKETERLATKWRIAVVVEFKWRDNPKAQFPGKTGVLRAGAR